MIPSVPGQPDLRLVVQLLKITAINSSAAQTKNNFFII